MLRKAAMDKRTATVTPVLFVAMMVCDYGMVTLTTAIMCGRVHVLPRQHIQCVVKNEIADTNNITLRPIQTGFYIINYITTQLFLYVAL